MADRYEFLKAFTNATRTEWLAGNFNLESFIQGFRVSLVAIGATDYLAVLDEYLEDHAPLKGGLWARIERNLEEVV